jgi:hypothetical protein
VVPMLHFGVANNFDLFKRKVSIACLEKHKNLGRLIMDEITTYLQQSTWPSTIFNLDYDDGEEDEDNDNLGVPSSSSNADEVNLDLIVEGFGIYEKSVLGEILKDNVIGSLNNKMKEIHIITNPISQTSAVVLGEEQEPSVSENQSSIDGCTPARYNDVIKIILNLDKNRENGKKGWKLLQKTPILVLKILHCP